MNDPRVRAHHLIYAHKYPPDENAKQVIEGLLNYCGSVDAENERLRSVLSETLGAWLMEANMGDGIDEMNVPVFERARATLQKVMEDKR